MHPHTSRLVNTSAAFAPSDNKTGYQHEYTPMLITNKLRVYDIRPHTIPTYHHSPIQSLTQTDQSLTITISNARSLYVNIDIIKQYITQTNMTYTH